MSEAFPFVRITVLGSAGCGKTSLINSFVNNCLPPECAPTKFPELYYRVVRLPPEADPTGPTTPVCAEIEDTIPPEMAEEPGVEEGQYEKTAPTLKNVQYFFNMARTPITVPEEVTDFTPFAIWDPPAYTLSAEHGIYKPLTQTRMAFLIVFDSNERESFDTACRIHSMLMESLDVQRVRVRPYICFVANKTEKDPLSEEHKLIIEQAEQYTQRAFVRLMKVSAVTAKNVKRTFWDLLYLVIGNQVLWELEYKRPPTAAAEDEAVT